MNLLKILNSSRRKIMPHFTKNIGASHYKRLKRDNSFSVKNILMIRPNHRLGNLLLTTPLLNEISRNFPSSKIDIIVKGNLGSFIFQNYSNVNTIISLPRKPFKELLKYISTWISVRSKTYDLVINVVEGSSSGKLLTRFSKGKYKVYGGFDFGIEFVRNDYEHIAKKPIYNLRYYLNKVGFKSKENTISPLDLKLSNHEILNGLRILKRIVNNNKKTISIFTFATGAKCYTKFWWTEFHNNLESEYKDYNIIEILPVENVSQINFKTPSFYSKNIREIAALIANTEVFIGADSGIMHLASSSFTPTIGLFSITNLKKYGPFYNGSIALDTNKTNIEGCIELLDNILIQNHKLIPKLINNH